MLHVSQADVESRVLLHWPIFPFSAVQGEKFHQLVSDLPAGASRHPTQSIRNVFSPRSDNATISDNPRQSVWKDRRTGKLLVWVFVPVPTATSTGNQHGRELDFGKRSGRM